MRPLRVLTWHIHGSYLYYLTQTPVEFYVLSKPDRPPGYAGRFGHFPWGANVHDLPVERVHSTELDCLLFQARQHYLHDQHELLTEAQRQLPRIYLEHDPPREHPTDTRHVVDDTGALLVHVTHFNQLMWDSGRTPTRVIPHGVIVPEQLRYTGELARGIAVINHLKQRGRRLGLDIYRQAARCVPLDLVGMASEDLREIGGLGEVRHDRLAAFEARYRFLFNPIRYTSLGLAVCEAMMLGMPIVGLATTEMARTIENGVSGYVDTDVEVLIARMRELLNDRRQAEGLGSAARAYAHQHFHIERFKRDWLQTFNLVCAREQRHRTA
jgi:Glycosyl transferases group 1